MNLPTINSTLIGGALLSLFTAALWAISPMLMASAGRRVGSFPVVLVRSLLASIMLAVLIGLIAAITGGWPSLPNNSQIGWLVLSGFIGMGIGDVLIYEAFVTLGPRRTTQALVLAPAVTVFVAWSMLGEVMSLPKLIGVALILGATFYAVLKGQRKRELIAGGESGDVAAPVEPGEVTTAGVLFGVGGAVCMAIGAVTARRAFTDPQPMDPVTATFIRVASAGALLWIAPVVRRQVSQTLAVLRDRHVLSRVAAGTLLGPFVGMFCYVTALKLTPAGLVSTLVATSPLLAIPITMVRYKARIGWDVYVAAVVAVVGVGILCLT